MIRKLSATLAAALCLGLAGPAAFAADPSLHQVYQAAEAGNYRAAQAMMDQVLKDHPNSAKAHFVEAELLAKEGQLQSARVEFNTAQNLDPALGFAKPGAVAELKSRLAGGSATGVAQPAAAAAAPAPSFPWGWLLLGGALLAAIVFFIARLRNPPVTVLPAGAGAGGGWNAGPGWGSAPPAPQPYGPAPTGGGLGSGILGGLATGAAVGAGMVAGEALMHRVLDGGSHESGGFISNAEAGTALPRNDGYDMGGQDFGVNDADNWDDGNNGGGDDWS